jgi:methanogenic corrinoid protein MtbC1
MIDFDAKVGLPISVASEGRFDASIRIAKPGVVGTGLPDNDYLALATTIESEIIPRLLRAHRADPHPKSGVPAPSETAQQAIKTFTRFVIDHDETALHDVVAGLLAQGTTLDAVFLDLLAPTADLLGELWWSDDCTFTDVTLALFKLQSLLRAFGNDAPYNGVKREETILIAAVPGSQHIFGCLMVEAFFRRSGWTTLAVAAATAEEIIASVRRQWFSAVGLSMSADSYAPHLPGLIATLRRASRNKSIAVIVGGAFFNAHPEQVALMGADSTALDARDAVVRTKRLVTATPRH